MRLRQRGDRGKHVVGDVRESPIPGTCLTSSTQTGWWSTSSRQGRRPSRWRVFSDPEDALFTALALTPSYPYLSLRGNVPAGLFVEDAASFAQLRVLKGALAAFGYEWSFLRRSGKQLLKDAGLASAEVGRFDTYIPLLKIPPSMRGLARRLARLDLFAPMYHGTGARGLKRRADVTG